MLKRELLRVPLRITVNFAFQKKYAQISKYLSGLWPPVVDAIVYVLVISARVLPDSFMT